MGKNVTIKWYGRAEQGVMTAASTLAEIMAASGKYVQAFPEFNIKKCGAPIAAYNRFSASPIKIHSLVENADIEVIMDQEVLENIDLHAAAKQDTVYILNTSLSPAAIKEKYNLDTNRILTLDTTTASPHIGLMSLVIDCAGLLPIDSFKERLKEIFNHKRNGEKAAVDAEIIDRALREVRQG